MEKLLSLLKPARRKNCDQLFFIFAQFARIGMDERRYLLRRGVLQLFAEFSKSVAERTALGTPRFNVQQVTHLVDVRPPRSLVPNIVLLTNDFLF
jgi:hypothetical protein